MANKLYLQVEGIHVPLKIKREWRSSVRFSISKKSVNLTVPKFYTKNQLAEELGKINEWAALQFKSSPSIMNRFIPKEYKDKDIFKIYGQTFKLVFLPGKARGLSGSIENEQVCIRYPEGIDSFNLNKSTGILLSRLFSKHFLPDVKSRVGSINNRYFREQINAVRLKNNQSNWGSCSTKRNINLSSRLLFAPRDVFDYVIIHELAHLKEMNHSPKFWSIVASVMPDYKEKEEWLDLNGTDLRF